MKQVSDADFKRLQDYDNFLSDIMPSDFKDWWQNDKSDWPLVTQMLLVNKNAEISSLMDQLIYANTEIKRLKTTTTNE